MAPDEALVRVLLSPINPSDLHMVRGRYGYQPELPASPGASGHTYDFTRHANGTTDIDVVVVREGKNLKGHLLGFVLKTIGRSVLEKGVRKLCQSHRSTKRCG